MFSDNGELVGLRYVGRRKYGEKNIIVMIGGRYIFILVFFFLRERYLWYNIG